MRLFLVIYVTALLAPTIARADGDAHIVQTFNGNDGSAATATFNVQDKWEVAWFSPQPLNITLLSADGQVIGGMHTLFKGSWYQARGGTYYFQIEAQHAESKAPWTLVVAEVASGTRLSGPGIPPMLSNPGESNYTPPAQPLPPGGNGPAEAGGANAVAASAPPATATPSLTNAAPTPIAPAGASGVPLAKLSEDQARAVVLIKGDKAEGTGFLVKTPNGPAVVTNIHVIADNPNFKITTNTGAFIAVLSQKCASDRDLAMLAVQDNPAAPLATLEMAPDISAVVQPGDEVITPGNSQGGEVMLNTAGKVLGIGPERIEIDNPIYHGNSGGPVFHTKSGKVLGVVTEAIKVNMGDDLDKASFASRNSAIGSSMRYFALRLDTVSSWIDVDPSSFRRETAFLTQFQEQNRRLDSYLNTPESTSTRQASSSDSDGDTKIYLTDEKIMHAEHDYDQEASGGDTAQHIEAARSWVFDMQGVADQQIDVIQSLDRFYPFDRERAQEELAYRRALKGEIDSIGNNIERLSHLPRSN